MYGCGGFKNRGVRGIGAESHSVKIVCIYRLIERPRSKLQNPEIVRVFVRGLSSSDSGYNQFLSHRYTANSCEVLPLSQTDKKLSRRVPANYKTSVRSLSSRSETSWRRKNFFYASQRVPTETSKTNVYISGLYTRCVNERMRIARSVMEVYGQKF